MTRSNLIAKVRVFGALMMNVAERSRKAKLKNVVQEMGAEKRKRYGLYLSDLGAKAWFQFNIRGEMDWGLGYKGIGKDIDTEVFTDFDTLMCLKIGQIKVVGEGGGLEVLPFTFFDAWKIDRIRFTGEGSTTDVKRFTDLLKVHPEVFDKLVG